MRNIDNLWVLFVDDERRVLDGFRREMRKVKPQWKLYFASSAFDAIEIINSHINEIDVVVCDIKMPIMSGLDVLRIAKQLYPRVLRIALSGHIDVYTLLDADKITHLHLCKPISSDQLAGKISESYLARKIPKGAI